MLRTERSSRCRPRYVRSLLIRGCARGPNFADKTACVGKKLPLISGSLLFDGSEPLLLSQPVARLAQG